MQQHVQQFFVNLPRYLLFIFPFYFSPFYFSPLTHLSSFFLCFRFSSFSFRFYETFICFYLISASSVWNFVACLLNKVLFWMYERDSSCKKETHYLQMPKISIEKFRSRHIQMAGTVMTWNFFFICDKKNRFRKMFKLCKNIHAIRWGRQK